jgi:catalase
MLGSSTMSSTQQPPTDLADITATQSVPTTPVAAVDAINAIYGKQGHSRAIYAKGIVASGTFTASSSASTLSRAQHLVGPAVPVTVRFSNFGGNPCVSDLDDAGRPHGMALKFHMPDGWSTDLVAHSFNGFPAANAEDFHEMLVALAASGPDTPPPKPIDRFFATHPRARAFFEAPKPAPSSYASLRYFGVNSFKFTNASGRATHGRYQLVPATGERFLSPEQRAAAGPDYLRDELRRRLAQGSASFLLRAQLASDGDVIADPSVAWPDTRAVIELGEIAIAGPVEDGEAAERALLFSSGALPPGIEPADPMISFRSEVYLVSYGRRHGLGAE